MKEERPSTSGVVGADTGGLLLLDLFGLMRFGLTGVF